MRGGVGNVEKERLVAPCRALDVVDGGVADRVGKVVVRVALEVGGGIIVVSFQVGRRVKRGRAAEDAIEVIEAALTPIGRASWG